MKRRVVSAFLGILLCSTVLLSAFVSGGCTDTCKGFDDSSYRQVRDVDGLRYDGIGSLAGTPARKVSVRLDAAGDGGTLVDISSSLVDDSSYLTSARVQYALPAGSTLPHTFPVTFRSEPSADGGARAFDATFTATLEGTSIGRVCDSDGCKVSLPNARLLLVRVDTPGQKAEIAIDAQPRTNDVSCGNGALVR